MIFFYFFYIFVDLQDFQLALEKKQALMAKTLGESLEFINLRKSSSFALPLLFFFIQNLKQAYKIKILIKLGRVLEYARGND